MTLWYYYKGLPGGSDGISGALKGDQGTSSHLSVLWESLPLELFLNIEKELSLARGQLLSRAIRSASAHCTSRVRPLLEEELRLAGVLPRESGTLSSSVMILDHLFRGP